MKYTASYFKNDMPAWKRRKDPILSRLIYRPLSFQFAAVASKLNLSGNDVSYISCLVGIGAVFLFLEGSWYSGIAAALLVNLWLILDCTDGNLARSKKQLPFGDFADGISSYILVGLLFPVIALRVYFHGGVLFSSLNPWIILCGAWASSSDTLMRLVYQKYKNTERNLAEKGKVKISSDVRQDHERVGDIRVRLEAELGIGGILPALILIGTIAQALDLVVLYGLIYYGGSMLFATLLYIRKARSNERPASQKRGNED